ncbi:hypothetical protein P4T54_11205 [Bacillus mycoides]|uniref:hypothetical protein n=1 Tax=Bacillus mycoides TaxID=1405 RepID=UPI002E1D10B8|nr:hypothetical protein [Bacillus mycoides]MED1054515.1 hypothetical protein [Bacillus mycoides]
MEEYEVGYEERYSCESCGEGFMEGAYRVFCPSTRKGGIRAQPNNLWVKYKKKRKSSFYSFN